MDAEEPGQHLVADAGGHGERGGHVVDEASQNHPDVGQLQAVAAPGGLAEDGGGQSAVGAEEAGFAVVVGDEVPDTGLVDETAGFEGVGAGAAVAAVPVAQAQTPVGESGPLEGVEVGTGRSGPGAPRRRTGSIRMRRLARSASLWSAIQLLQRGGGVA